MKAAILAMSALLGTLGLSACNREAKDGGEDGAASTTEKIKEEAREAGQEVGEATDKAVAKTKEETRQTARDVKEGAEKLTSKTKEGAKDAGGAAKEAAGGLMPGDAAKTESDRQLVTRIRQQLAADKEIASEARDVRIEADGGKVELEGTVTSQEAKAKIGRVAGRLAGAQNVKDGMKVAEQVGTGNTDR